ncbi:hypothetical protein NSK_005170 [Nannochloropsis salina CCMP1776]|uniref:Tudor domain-containing protein n=1 Tax=Nannochloropsis salina CCMP1776 TaxID=1027361 RepID=A0A4D9D0P2_9STRA|nr:hypothetical protein NSK_005170 [Nannochloropsis salina CCMP1776]|eukprot:TFJ83523.1 hypothetical protein NSK_005170 [Nannochloropsis salina CCMP1776]
MGRERTQTPPAARTVVSTAPPSRPMQSVQELRANLATYKSQADQVRSLLATDPGNAAYEQLERDLQAAMKLTRELMEAQGAGQAAAEAEQGWEGPGPSTVTASAPAVHLELRKGEAAWTPGVGDRVEAPWAAGERLYPAVVTGLAGGGETLTLKYYGYAETEEKARKEVRRLRPPDGAAALGPGEVSVGWEGEALWGGDGEWYGARVLGLVEHGYRVKYLRYGNEGERAFKPGKGGLGGPR